NASATGFLDSARNDEFGGHTAHLNIGAWFWTSAYPRNGCRKIAMSHRAKNFNATPKDIFDWPRARSRNAIGISQTRKSRPPWIMVSKTILNPLVGGAIPNKRERAMAKKPHIESRTPVTG